MMILHDKMKQRLHTASGVTMVEMALVMLVIAVLLAAILGYREIIRIAYLKKMATEIQSYGTAARAFEQKYDALPGDYADASENIPGCQPGNGNFCQNGNGDNNIGRYCHFGWPECFQTGSTIPAANPDGGALSASIPLETSMFWKHLNLSGFIGSAIIPTADPSTPVWGQSHPSAPVNRAGYTVSSGTSFLGGLLWVNVLPTPETNPLGSGIPEGMRALSIRDAQWLDEKYDNAGPGSGFMWWYPVGNMAQFDGNGSLIGGTGTGCRRSDGGVQNTWETASVDRRNCIMSWSVY